MKAREMIAYLHYDMQKTYKEDDIYQCHASILKDWSLYDSFLPQHREQIHHDPLQIKYGFKQNLKFTDFTLPEDLFMQYVDKAEELGEEDVYFSVNSFYRSKRKTETVRHLNAFVIDYDYYKIDQYKDLSPAEMFDVIRYSLPAEPTFAVDSGRGLYIIYAIEHAGKQFVKLYQSIYEKLCENQISFGADPKATLVTQMIRIPGSINTNTLKEVSIIFENKTRYKIQDLANRILPYSLEQVKEYKNNLPNKDKSKPDKSIAKEKRKNKVQNELDLFLEDLNTLIELRNANEQYEGYRELLIYLIWERMQYLGFKLETIKKQIDEVNKQFYNPLDHKTLYQQCKPSATYAFVTGKEKIISKLQITKIEQRQMKYIFGHAEYIRRHQKENRHPIIDQKRTSKQKKIYSRRKEVLKLLFSEKRPEEIAEALNVSKKTIERDLSYISHHLCEFKDFLSSLLKAKYNQIHNVLEEILCNLDFCPDMQNFLRQKLLL